MIYKTGYLLGASDRNIQVETILAFYRQQFVCSGKSLLFEEGTLIGYFVLHNAKWVCNGMSRFTNREKEELLSYVKNIEAPVWEKPASEFGFGLQLDGNITYCEVIVNGSVYDIWFDGAKVAKIDQDEQRKWIQVLGKPVPVLALTDISHRIEQHYGQNQD